MENQKLYKSDQGKASILAMYDAKLASLNLAYESRIVETSFGETHLLVCGQSENPPLFLLHGSLKPWKDRNPARFSALST